MSKENWCSFIIGDMTFEYDKEKNEANKKKHGRSFEIAARVFFDYNRIELYDEENSDEEDRFDTIGSTLAGVPEMTMGNLHGVGEEIIFVVYTERVRRKKNGEVVEITRIISARMATSFERGLYYGKHD